MVSHARAVLWISRLKIFPVQMPLVLSVVCSTVVPLLTDTLAKGYPSNKDRIIWHQIL